MVDVNVYFLGKQYSVPAELKEFVGYLRYFEDIHDRIMPLLTNQINQQTYSGGAEADFIYFKEPLSKIGEEVIAKLAERNIFDVSLNDIVYNNRGFINLHTVCKETIKGMLNILVDSWNTLVDGYSNAYSSATSNIIGSGVSIWTSSLSTALLCTAFEASTIKRQANKANRQYIAAIESLDTRINDTKKKQETNLLINKYYPGVAEALGLFVSEMAEYYISKLEQYGIFDYSKVKKYNLQRSSDLLKNISIVTDKIGLLKEIFICCPYNPDLYSAVMENGLADIPTFETAKYFMQDDVLIDVIYSYAKNNIGNIDSIKIPVKILASYKGQEESSIWKSLYSKEYLKLVEYYKKLNYIIKKRSALIAWIKENITHDAVELCSMSESDLTIKVKAILEIKVISNEQFSLFNELSMLSNELCISTTQSLNALNENYASAIVCVIIELIQELKRSIDNYRARLELAKQQYEMAQIAYEKKIEELQNKETSLKQQRAALSIFAFPKKKELSIKIHECQEELLAFKETDNTQKLKQEYEEIYKKVHSLDIFEN